MKIVINAASAKMGGAVTYLSNLLRHLPALEGRNQFFVFLPNETAKGLPDLPASIRLCPLPDHYAGGWRRSWWEQVTLRRFLVSEKIDVLFSTANFATFRCPVRQLLLVRNALYFSRLYQQMFLCRHNPRMQVAFRLRRWLICRSVRSADIVVTPTRAMLDEVRAYVDIPDSRRLVNPYGIEAPAAPARFAIESPPGAAVRLLYVSLYAEHKNLHTLLRALPLLNEDGGGKFLLQTTADPAWEGAAWTVTHREDIALAREPGVAAWVRFVGPLSKEQTSRLYLDSDVFVFPSLAESFGHPMAEAMSYGLPIVAADTPVNREVCGEAAVYFRPLDPEDLAHQVQRVASDVSLRQRLSMRGREDAHSRFSWDNHVRNILSAASGIGRQALEARQPAHAVE